MINKRIVICGSVDDGKSTLIGRLLFDSNNVPVDEIKIALELDETSSTNLEFTKKTNNFDLKISSKYNFFSDIPDYGANIIVSNSF